MLFILVCGLFICNTYILYSSFYLCFLAMFVSASLLITASNIIAIDCNLNVFIYKWMKLEKCKHFPWKASFIQWKSFEQILMNYYEVIQLSEIQLDLLLRDTTRLFICLYALSNFVNDLLLSLHIGNLIVLWKIRNIIRYQFKASNLKHSSE